MLRLKVVSNWNKLALYNISYLKIEKLDKTRLKLDTNVVELEN